MLTDLFSNTESLLVCVSLATVQSEYLAAVGILRFHTSHLWLTDEHNGWFENVC